MEAATLLANNSIRLSSNRNNKQFNSSQRLCSRIKACRTQLLLILVLLVGNTSNITVQVVLRIIIIILQVGEDSSSNSTLQLVV